MDGNAPLVPNEIPLDTNEVEVEVSLDEVSSSSDDATSALEDENLTSNRPGGVLRLLTDDLDVPNTIGSTGRSRRDTGSLVRMDSDSPAGGSSPSIVAPYVANLEAQEMQASSPRLRENDCPQWMKRQWEVNYKEAAIFLEEGYNNDKFTHHPRCQEALPAYLLVHNDWFHFFDLGASLILLGLAFFEQPCSDSLCFPTHVHSSIELGTLILIICQVVLKTRLVFAKYSAVNLPHCTW